MTKYRVTTENGDTLFYGTKSATRPRFAGWASLDFQGSDAQHTELSRHLSRHNDNWSRGYTGADGVSTYLLPPYFKTEPVNDWDSEQDAAVATNRELPVYGDKSGQPTARLTGKDPYTTLIDPLFLDLGERFRAERTRGGRKEVRYGTAAIVGFGLREEFHDRYLGESPLESYINVHWDDEPEGHYAPSVCADRRRGIAYVPQGAGWPNDTLYPEYNANHVGDKGGWTVYGLPEVGRRKTSTVAAYRRAKAVRAAAIKVDKLKAELASAEKALRDAEKSATVES